ncbi:hypothetical protein FRX31_034752 [Thalictrum thalictroides]|uniref:Uncharacterized protein n=1 Tax=Thalictrum thalictroides TaxID=46969 RepID=A0A7J6UTT0_THATH|nr:hypothetical protein FRX31_034752 [Thalictrum thalictroides]
MASACNRFVSRSSLQSLKNAIKSTSRSSSINGSAASRGVPLSSSNSTFTTTPSRRISSFITRSPSELRAVQSMLPLHSAVAASRLTSCLSTNSRSCRSLSQELGLSVPR